MFKVFEPIEYLCIDIANNFGDDPSTGFKGDKELFETRIQWVKDNFNRLEERYEEADEKYLYIKAVMALRDVMQGKATGHTVMLDASCSGLQIMSCLTGCKRGGDMTGLIDPNKRSDAYTEITDQMNLQLSQLSMAMIKINRADAKEAVMTSAYGSKAKPLEIFGEALIDQYYDACHIKAPGAFQLLDVLISAWNPYTLNHTWELPDGHVSHVKVMETVETEIEIDELNHHKFSTKFKVNKGSKRGVSLAANVTHSIDSYVLRSVIRRTNYNVKRVTRALDLLTKEMKLRKRSALPKTDKLWMEQRELRFNLTNIVDASTLDAINKHSIGYLSKAHMLRLKALAETMLKHKPFETLTVHDAFKCHMNNCNQLRFWYKELLAELSESELLSDILTQISGKEFKYKKLSNNMGELIRNSNYSLG